MVGDSHGSRDAGGAARASTGVAADAPVVVDAVTSRFSPITRLSLTAVLLAYGIALGSPTWLFWAAMAVGVVWPLTALALMHREHWGPRYAYGVLVLDTTVLACIVLGTGGGSSPLPQAVLLLAAVSGLMRRPMRAALTGALVVVIDVVGALPDLISGEPVWNALVADVATAAFATVVGVAFAHGLTRLVDHAIRVDRARRQLLTSSLDAEDAERRRVSRELGGEALQILLSASQDLEEAGARPEALTDARAQVRSGVAVLRQTVRDLHPTALRHAGLEAALRVALEHRVQGEVEVEVAPDAIGVREGLLLALVREIGEDLRATERDEHVKVSVSRDGDCLELAVSAGTEDPLVAHGALAPEWEGRVGLLRERVEADGGRLERRDAGGATQLVACISVDGHTSRAELTPVEPADVASASTRALSLVRVAALPFGTLVLALDGQFSAAVITLASVLLLWELASAWFLQVATDRPPWPAVVDLALLGGLVAVSGGTNSALLPIVLVVPFLLVYRAAPRVSIVLAVVLALSTTLAFLPDLLSGEPGAVDRAWPWYVGFTWSIAAALKLGRAREELRLQLAQLERKRRRVLHDSLAAADEERRRLSEELHDNALQVLMIAGQDLDEALLGDRVAQKLAAQELDDGIRLIKRAMDELHPPALEHGGLRPAVVALLEAAKVRGGFQPVVAVSAEAAGVRDELVLALVRELVNNAAKHAQASEVRVRVARQGGELLLEVADDGVGIALGRPAEAVAAGHIGLASARERVEVDGGRLELDTAPGQGTRVRIRLVATPTSVLL